jgi:sterol desaturase/sphingolipid hydroxylase (fatty acid hydroxylase superfamily)
MIWPPLLIIIRITDDSQSTKFFLPLPVFLLLLPLVIILGVVLLPVAIVATIAFWNKGWGFSPFKVIWYIYKLYCALRGLSVDVSSPRHIITISII